MKVINNSMDKDAELIWEAYIKKLTSNEDFARIEQIDNTYFFDNYAAQDKDDLMDDTEQPGFRGVGLFDDNDIIQGYLYGYSVTKDEIEEIEDIEMDTIKIYKDEIIKGKKLSEIIKTPKKILKYFTPKNSIYVANLVIEKNYRFYTFKLLQTYFESLRSAGITYLFFDALPDSKNLFIKNNKIKSSGVKSMFNILLEIMEEDYYIMKL